MFFFRASAVLSRWLHSVTFSVAGRSALGVCAASLVYTALTPSEVNFLDEHSRARPFIQLRCGWLTPRPAGPGGPVRQGLSIVFSLGAPPLEQKRLEVYFLHFAASNEVE